MKFKLIAKDLINVSAYGHHGISTGDIIFLDGHLAGKASQNPDFQVTNEEPKPVVKKVVKKAAKKKAK